MPIAEAPGASNGATASAHERAFRALGGAPAIRDRFGISVQAAHKWATRIPVNRARVVEALTGIAAADLHPDVFGTVADVHQESASA